MRIRRLRLLAFGPFAGEELPLGATRGTVDVVYGPNEAGKSTTLRAIFGLLFGIPEKTADAHRYAPSELRVGGVLETEQGETLDFVRRKGRKATLLSPDGKPLGDDALVPFLGGTNAELFGSMFGLDHVTLRASAKALLDGKGSVGESLFSAGIGANGIRALRERLHAEADSLFTTRGRDQKAIVKAISELREAKRTVDELSVSARAALAQKQALDEAVREREALRERRAALGAERARIERLLEVSPHLAQREQILSDIEHLGDVVILPRDAPERRRLSVRALEEARNDRRRAAEAVERIEARLGEIVVPDGLLGLEDAVVRNVDAGRGRHVGAENDLPKRLGELAALEEAVDKTIAAIDPRLGRDAIERLRIGVAKAAKIRKCAEESRALGAETARVTRESSALTSKRDALVSRLRVALGPQTSLDADARLFESPGSALVPPADVSRKRAEEVARFDAERAGIVRDRTRAAGRGREVDRDVAALLAHGAVPTETDLGAARRARDAEIEALRGEAAAGAGSARRFEAAARAVAAADDVADRLRREAGRVAQLASLSADRAALGAELSALGEQERELSVREGARLAAFEARFSALGIVPLPPDEMRAWSDQFSGLVDLDGERARLAGELDGLSRDREKWQSEWTELMALLGLPKDATPDEAVALLDATNELLRRLESCEQMRRRIEGMRRDSQAFIAEVSRLCRERYPAAAELPAVEAARSLVHAHEQARRDDAERVRLAAEHRRLSETRTELDATAREAEERVATLLAAGRAADLDALEAAERRSEAALDLFAERERVERRLAELGDGAKVEDLVVRTRDFDANRARARLSELEREIEDVSEARDEVIRRITTLEAGALLVEQTKAADAASDAAERAATLRRHVHRYVRVRLASVILDREIERYRQANQGPLVQRASELFPRLTVGRYTGLRVGFGMDDEAVLRAVRADGTDVGIEALSDGTRDQLYLALRLASLERHAHLNEPMPLVLDDVLVHSDDERARAALEVLGDVAQTTEVLFFTHHARLVDLAREALGESRLALHRLSGG